MLASSPLLSIGRLALIVFCLGLVLILALFLLPIYLDITALKGPVEEILTEIIEAPVTVEEVEVNLSIWPTLKLKGIEVQGSGHDDAPIFTHVQKAEIRISLLPLVRKELRVKHLDATGLDFHVQRHQGETGNWPVWTTMAYSITELSDIAFNDVTVFLDDHDLGQSDAQIGRLELDIATNRSLDLDIRGTFEGLPLALEMSGPTLTNLSPRASDFPVAVHLELADLRLDLSGTARRQPEGTQLSLEVEAASPNWVFLESLGDIVVPDIGGFEVASHISVRGSRLEFSDLHGAIGSTSVHSKLSLDVTTNQPRVEGEMHLGDVDLEPWLDQSDGESINSSDQLPFGLLSKVDAALELSIEALDGLEHQLENITATIDLVDGALSLPLELRVAAIPVAVNVEVQQRDTPPEVTAEIRVQDLDVEQLRSLVELPEHLTGHLGQITIAASASGQSVDELTQSLSAHIEAEDMSLVSFDEETGETIEVALDRTTIAHQTGQPLTLSTTGVFLTESFRIDLETVPFDDLVNDNLLPVFLTMEGSGAAITLDGVVKRQAPGSELDFDFEIAGASLGRLEAWLGLPPDSSLPYHLKGRWLSNPESRSLRLDEATIGRTRLQGTLARAGARQEAPLVADLQVSALDLQELQSLLDPVTDLDTEEEIIGFDLPILPSGLSFGDAMVELTVDRLYREPVDLTNIRASLDFRSGQLEPSPFSFDYLGTEFNGDLHLDLRGDLPRFSLDLTGSAKALDQILDQEDLISDARVNAEQLEVSIAATGATVRQIVKSAEVSGRITNVHLPISLPESSRTLDVHLADLRISGPEGEPIVLESEGFLDQEPLHLRIVLRKFDRSQEAQDLSTPFQLQVALAGTRVELDGEIVLPVSRRELDVDLVLVGESVSDLSSITDRQLPELGPYRVEGRLILASNRLALKDFLLTLRESDLGGSLEYRLLEGRPTFSGQLSSKQTRTEDYLPGLGPVASGNEEVTAKKRNLAELEKPELSLELLNRFDASINLEIGELDTGTGPLEHITATMELDQGRLQLLAQRPQPGDKMSQITVAIEPLDRGIDVDLHAQWERQPYGLLADMISPGKAQGTWSLDLALQTRGATFDELLENLGGHIDFTDYPIDFDATIFDLWGGGLLGSLMPVFNIGEQSRVNCTVGRFIVDEGVLRPELLVLDATRNRVRMRGYVDLPNDYIKLRLNPRPKQRSLINLATPVKLRGPIADPSIRFATSGIAVTAFRFSLWVYTVWVDLLRKPLPTDGSDICLDPQVRGH